MTLHPYIGCTSGNLATSCPECRKICDTYPDLFIEEASTKNADEWVEQSILRKAATEEAWIKAQIAVRPHLRYTLISMNNAVSTEIVALFFFEEDDPWPVAIAMYDNNEKYLELIERRHLVTDVETGKEGLCLCKHGFPHPMTFETLPEPQRPKP